MSKRVRDELILMILHRVSFQGRALRAENFQKAAVLGEQIKGIEAVYEALSGTGALDFELDKEKGEQDG